MMFNIVETLVLAAWVAGPLVIASWLIHERLLKTVSKLLEERAQLMTELEQLRQALRR